MAPLRARHLASEAGGWRGLAFDGDVFQTFLASGEAEGIVAELDLKAPSQGRRQSG